MGYGVRGDLTYISPACEKISGYGPTEIMAQPDLLEEIVDLDSLAQYQTNIDRSRTERKELRFDYSIVTKSGEKVWVERIEKPILDDQGEFIGYRASIRDITDRKDTETKLARSRGLWKNYLMLGQVGLAVTSLEKGWVEYNDRLCEILGYDRATLSTKTWIDVTYPDDIDADVANFELVLSGKTDGYSIEKRFINGADGHIVYARISMRAIRAGDEIDHFVAIVEDVTELKEAQLKAEELNRELEERVAQRTRALEQANLDLRKTQSVLIQSEKMAAIGSMAAGLAHELNNPMMGIVNYVEYARANVPDDSKIFEVLNKALGQLTRVQNLATSFLDLSRPKDEIKIELVELSDTLERSVDLIGASMRAKDIQLIVDTATDCIVLGNDDAIQQILLNLLINARDAVENSEVRKVQIAIEPAEEFVCVSVTDTGPGVPAEIQDRIFDPFYTTKAIDAGSGLGLTISSRLAHEIGGRIELASAAETSGARFNILLKNGKSNRD